MSYPSASISKMSSIEADAIRLLRQMIGPDAAFRNHQLDAIIALVEGRSRVLLVQRTGWGKSAVYLISSRLLRDRGAGATILISPLLALMRNQIEMALRAGVHARTINSANKDDWEQITEEINEDKVDLLLISPERLNNIEFRADVLPVLASKTGLLVVDEVHCISDWGHDFRPDYRRVKRVLDILPGNVPVLGTTATANERVIADIQAQFGTNLLTLRGSLDRESLHLYVLNMPSQADRLAWLSTYIPTLPGTGIVYCLTVDDARRVSEWLRKQGIAAPAYFGDEDPVARERIEQDLLDDRLKAVVATSALGMGYDKPDLGFVIHYQSPGSPVAYYQQVGRAGRAVPRALGILMTGAEDTDIQDYFITTAFSPKHQAESVIALLEERAEPVSKSEIPTIVNVRPSRLDAMLKILEVDGAIERSKKGWLRTLRPWTYDEQSYEAITAQRRLEQKAMREYGETSSCLMLHLQDQLDDDTDSPCGRCANCGADPLPTQLDPKRLIEARDFLRTRPIVLQPRLRWPANNYGLKGAIDRGSTIEEGRALSQYGDGGWGGLVRTNKLAGSFPDELVTVSAQLVNHWQPDPPPEWVSCVPSTSYPGLVPDFAARLADALGLPFHSVVGKVRTNKPQKEMENSSQQFRNVYRAFEITGDVPEGPVLLVDDIADSRWTMTVIGAMLRQGGCSAVWPFVLAQAKGR